MTQSPLPRISGYRRLLRIALWLLGALASLTVMFALALIIINWHDKSLSPSAQAWLQEPTNPVSDADNAYLAMLAVGIENKDSTRTGRLIVDAMLKHNPENDTSKTITAIAANLGGQWQADDVETKICSARLSGPDILARILAARDTLEPLLKKHQAALARYHQAVGLTGFFEVTTGRNIAPLAPPAKAACLTRMNIAYRITANDDSAIPVLAQHMHYWLTATTQSQTLIESMVALAQVENDLALLHGFHTTHNALFPQLFRRVEPDLQKFAALPLAPLRKRITMSEFRFMVAGLEGPTNSAELSGPLLENMPKESIFFKPKDTINQVQQQFENAQNGQTSEHTKSCSILGIRLYNPLGRILACMSRPKLDMYFSRIVTQQEAATRLLADSKAEEQ